MKAWLDFGFRDDRGWSLPVLDAIMVNRIALPWFEYMLVVYRGLNFVTLSIYKVKKEGPRFDPSYAAMWHRRSISRYKDKVLHRFFLFRYLCKTQHLTFFHRADA